jgi:hypothetical protein
MPVRWTRVPIFCPFRAEISEGSVLKFVKIYPFVIKFMKKFPLKEGAPKP